MNLFYAEQIDAESCKIVEKGVFMSIAEFAPYRALGWTGTEETNTAADEYLLQLGYQELGRTLHD